MSYKTVKVSDLSGPALDWAVAKCEGVKIDRFPEAPRSLFYGPGFDKYKPSTNWGLAGPIIEREFIDIEGRWNVRGCGVRVGFKEWKATHPKNHGGLIRFYGYGATPLIAAMRCYVASRLGDTIEIPEELV